MTEKECPSREAGAPTAPTGTAESTAMLRHGAAVAVYDWRHAARLAEVPAGLGPVDVALTATGLAAEIRDWLGRFP